MGEKEIKKGRGGGHISFLKEKVFNIHMLGMQGDYKMMLKILVEGK